MRSGIVAFSIGTSSSSGPCEITKPPTCCERWRGKPSSSPAQVEQQFDRRIAGFEAGLAHALLVDRRVSHHCIAPASRSACTGVEAERLAMSRSALRGR